MPSNLTISAPAKVNLYLAVGGVRPDGYHDVETVLQAVDLADTITLEHSDELVLASSTDLGIPSSDNLAWRAAEALASAVGRKPDLRITLEKRIPHGAGLGGGSSDAAAVLAGAARIWGIDPSDPVLHVTAAGLGADVPFFLEGGTALFGGRGDELLGPLPTVEAALVLVRPPVSISTPDAYVAFDAIEQAEPPSSVGIVRACESGDPAQLGSSLFNNMTAAAISIEHEVEEAIAWTRRAEGVGAALMAGSGSCVFGICHSDEIARVVADAARRQGWWAQATRTRATGVQVTLAEGL